MALTAQKVALMVLMLGLLMMGVTVMALAGEAPLPTGRTLYEKAYQQGPYEVKPGYSNVSNSRHFAKNDYVHPATTEAVAAEETVLPEPFPQPLY